MIQRPESMGAFQFVVLAKLRAAQLLRGCVPLLAAGNHRATITAQMEVAAGHVQATEYDPRHIPSVSTLLPVPETAHV